MSIVGESPVPSSPLIMSAQDTTEETPLLRTMSKDSSTRDQDVGAITRDENDPVGEVVQAYDESRKIGVTGAVFLILNKMIGTGSEFHVDHEMTSKLILDDQSFQRLPESLPLLGQSESQSCCG